MDTSVYLSVFIFVSVVKISSCEGWQNNKAVEEITEQTFKEADKDQSGEISESEIRELVKNGKMSDKVEVIKLFLDTNRLCCISLVPCDLLHIM